ncbi:MAG: MBL fold metallo-hydrolase [Proteobacteria bacterium]|nr:MBL fold metallo-hydrolase [Pseudomonadota bacterium]MBU1714077.1 MBL fold metallo-hydrolase [Pseudomonadota bacterium]
MLKLKNQIIALCAMCLSLTACAAKPSDHPDKPHHTKNGFKNVHHYEPTTFWDFLKWRLGNTRQKEQATELYNFQMAENDPAFLRQNRTRNTATWIGHATLLLQLNGKNILTDPIFADRASPVQWAGPRRVMPPGLTLADLPAIDFVLISHDHYDALDQNSVLSLRARPDGDKTKFFVPLGLKKWFTNHEISNVVELDWWEQADEPEITITAVPVQHWSKRSLFTKNKTLWAGWAMNSSGFNFFFAGDSGYTPHFKEIGERLGPFDLAAIPIGAYSPQWFMGKHHITPEEAMQVHEDIKSRQSIAIHWGTFTLTDERLDEPPKRLSRIREDKNLPPEEFIVLKHGQTIFLP